MKSRMIAIDGPAASGKSTLAQNLASALGYLYFDTGVMYRAVTLAALKSNTPVEDESAVTVIANELDLDVQPPRTDDGRQCDVLMDGEDVTWEIRSPAVDGNVSQVSMYPGVREAMTKRQREIGLRGAVVMVGRDIGDGDDLLGLEVPQVDPGKAALGVVVDKEPAPVVLTVGLRKAGVVGVAPCVLAKHFLRFIVESVPGSRVG